MAANVPKRNPRQSFHGVGLARQLVFKSGRARVVTVGRRMAPAIETQEAAEEKTGCGSKGDKHGSGTKPPSSECNTPPRALHSDFSDDSERHDMESESSTEFPTKIGPFLLESLSSREGSGAASLATTDSEPTSTLHGPTNTRTVEKHYFAARTVDWVESHTVDANSILPRASSLLATTQAGPSTNPTSMDTAHRERRQAPDDAAIRDNFIPQSNSLRRRSPSPRREQEPNGVYLQFSLTDSQMDRLTLALSSDDSDESFARGRARNLGSHAAPSYKQEKENAAPSLRSRSPTKSHQSNTTPPRARSPSPVKFLLANTPESQRTLQGFEGNVASASPSRPQSTRCGRNTATAHGTPAPSARRAVRDPPAPIDTDVARLHARLATERAGRQPIVVVHRPPERDSSPTRQPRQDSMADDASSYYSQDSPSELYPGSISPLRIHKEYGHKHVSILQEYTEQKHSARVSDKGSAELEQHGVSDEASSCADLAYTPLGPFIPKVPTVRKASKTLIGDGEWFENTSKPEQAPPSPTRGGGFLGNLVKKAKEMIEAGHDNRAQRRSRESDKSRPSSRQLAVSLSPREQSLLYYELEFALTTALNDYITAQFNAGRLEADKLRRVAEDWQRKGRPRVVGFRYDLETQLDLVRMHVHDFIFYSRAAATTAILGVLDTAKANARALRVRTFCQPDTVVAKHLLDAQGLFNILGCPEDQQIKLAEIVAFFKAAIERERVHARMEQQQQQQTASAAGTAPLRNSRSPKQGDDRWGTSAAAGQIRKRNSVVAGRVEMDPASFEA